MENISNIAAVGDKAKETVLRLNEFVFNPIISLLFGVALIVFLWGVAEYFWQAGSEAARQKGSQHMIYGVLGMFIMFAAFAILRIIAGTIGADVPESVFN